LFSILRGLTRRGDARGPSEFAEELLVLSRESLGIPAPDALNQCRVYSSSLQQGKMTEADGTA
jgi:hypothetical protein